MQHLNLQLKQRKQNILACSEDFDNRYSLLQNVLHKVSSLLGAPTRQTSPCCSLDIKISAARRQYTNRHHAGWRINSGGVPRNEQRATPCPCIKPERGYLPTQREATALKLQPIHITFFYIRAPSAQPHVTHEGGRMIASAPGLGRSGMRRVGTNLGGRPTRTTSHHQQRRANPSAGCRCCLLCTAADKSNLLRYFISDSKRNAYNARPSKLHIHAHTHWCRKKNQPPTSTIYTPGEATAAAAATTTPVPPPSGSRWRWRR